MPWRRIDKVDTRWCRNTAVICPRSSGSVSNRSRSLDNRRPKVFSDTVGPLFSRPYYRSCLCYSVTSSVCDVMYCG